MSSFILVLFLCVSSFTQGAATPAVCLMNIFRVMWVFRRFSLSCALLALFSSSAIGDGEAVGRSVDGYFGRDELMARRAGPSHSTDQCLAQEEASFFSGILSSVSLALEPRLLDLSPIATPDFDPYHLRGNPHPAAVGLLSHSMCPINAASLKVVLSSSHSAARMPDASTIVKMSLFAETYNRYREEARQGSAAAVKKARALWIRFLGCLSYVESLSDADRPASDRIAARYAPPDYRRPMGVNFYYDKGQPAESALNVGLFQFTPASGGNIQSCIREWNRFSPSCALSRRAPGAEMVRMLGSSRQRFNAFCGVIQILNTFYTQVNTTRAFGSHPDNLSSGGRLLDSRERCVTLHMRSGRAYNHFGPFQNSTGENLKELMACATAEEAALFPR